MAEEMKNSQIREFHMKVARSVRADPGIADLLQQTKDDFTRMWLIVCLLDGMDKESMLELAGVNISEIQTARNEYLKKKYVQQDALYQTVGSLKKQVAEELKESREIRASIEQGLDEALKQQVKTQEELVASKDEMIAMFEQKEYLLQCLEEGLSVKEMEVFASADLPVEIMRRLRKYYEQQKDGSIK